jgi:uroporphyrin-3 C-methyltransferase
MSQTDESEDPVGKAVEDSAAGATESPVGERDAEASEASSTATVDSSDSDVPSAGGRRGAYLIGALALICALLAGSAAGVLWWQFQNLSAKLVAAESATSGLRQSLTAEMNSFDALFADLQEGNEVALDLAEDLGERVISLPGRVRDVEERLNAVQGVSEDARRRWLLAEAEYYLSLANAELTLAGRWESATSALELADGKLAELASPVYAGVRQQIAAELLALRAARLPDIEGLSFSLGRLAASGKALPMLATVPENFSVTREVPADSASGLERAWLSLKNAIAGMVSIERTEEAVMRSLSTDEQALIRQHFELELILARLGMIRGQAELFNQSLAQARALLLLHFDTAEVSVESSIALLDEMAVMNIAPVRPDISGSLDRLNSLVDRDN